MSNPQVKAKIELNNVQPMTRERFQAVIEGFKIRQPVKYLQQKAALEAQLAAIPETPKTPVSKLEAKLAELEEKVAKGEKKNKEVIS